MTNEQILKQAIEKAVKNGFKNGEYHLEHGVMGMCLSVIFSPDFARAFWGEELEEWESMEKHGGTYFDPLPKWQYRLQQMVISKDPLQYLKKYL